MFGLLGVNSTVFIKFLFKVINHTLQGSVFTLISIHLFPLPDGKTDIEEEGFSKSTHFTHLLPLPLWGLRQVFGSSESIWTPDWRPHWGSPLTLWVHHGTEDGDSSLTLQLGCVSGSHFYTLSHGTIISPHSLNQRDMVSPQQAVTSGF
jgi:hypothetical protein